GKAPLVQDRAQRARDRRLTRPAGNERGIAGVDAHELACQRNGVAACYTHRSTPFSSIANGSSSPSGAMALRTAATLSRRAITSTQPPPDAPSAFEPSAPAAAAAATISSM